MKVSAPKKTYKNLYYWNISKFSGVAQLRIMVPKGGGKWGEQGSLNNMWSMVKCHIQNIHPCSDFWLNIKIKIYWSWV